MGRRAKNKQGPPQPLMPVKDATNKPAKSTVAPGKERSNKAAHSSPVKRKGDKIEELERTTERPLKKVKQDKSVVARKDEMLHKVKYSVKELSINDSQESDSDEEEEDSDGWDGIPDGANANLSKKYGVLLFVYCSI
jgi:hypothetical protein